MVYWNGHRGEGNRIGLHLKVLKKLVETSVNTDQPHLSSKKTEWKQLCSVGKYSNLDILLLVVKDFQLANKIYGIVK